MTLYWPSLVITFAVLLPNVLSLFVPPRNVQPPESKPSTKAILLTGLERIGQIGAFVTPVFSRFDSGVIRQDPVRFAAAVLCLLVYYIGWLRFFVRGRDYALYFAPLFGLPLPMAISPVLYFALMARVIGSPWLLASAFILAVSHIPISEAEYRRTRNSPTP